MPGLRHTRHGIKLDGDRVLAQAKAGISRRDIARDQGVGSSTIQRFLNKIQPENQAVEQFKAHRADILARLQGKSLALQERIIESLEKDSVFDGLTANQKQGLLHALTVVGGTAFDKERLERGQSTANISTISRMIDGQVSTLYKRTAPQQVVVEPSHNVGDDASD